MSNQKKQIILNEIAFWKKSKMLPEKYCDYLTMMYTEGNREDAELLGNAKESVRAKELNRFNQPMLFIILAAILISVALFAIPSVMVASIVVGVIAIGFIVTSLIYAKTRAALAIVLQIAAAIVLLALTVRVTTTYFAGDNIALYGGLAVNCLLWLLAGWKMKLHYFTFSGIFGLIVLIGSWFFLM